MVALGDRLVLFLFCIFGVCFLYCPKLGRINFTFKTINGNSLKSGKRTKTEKTKLSGLTQPESKATKKEFPSFSSVTH